MGLLDFVQPATKIIYLNTGTLYDLSTGSFELGVGGQHYLNGGLGLITGVSGKSGTYKSTIAESLIVRAMDIYPQTETVIYDTEQNKNNKYRYLELADNPNFNLDRIKMCDSTVYDIDTFWKEVIQRIADDKKANKKDYTVESPFLDPMTGKPIRMWIPTFVLIDSWTKASTSAEIEKINKQKNLADGSLNTIYMQDANMKTVLMRQAPKLAASYGIYLILTTHMDKKVEMGMMPEPKQMQFMKQSDKIKSAGSQFSFLTTTLIETKGAKIYVDSNKEPLYPYNGSSDVEINHVNSVVLRGKNQVAGLSLPMVVSQYEGLLPEVTNYDYLKTCDSFGLDGSTNVKCKLFNKINLTRKNLRENIKKTPELKRALQILGEYKYIQNNWSTNRLVADFTKTDDEFVAALLKSPLASDVLNSRSYWTYDKENKLPYMNIFDIARTIK